MTALRALIEDQGKQRQSMAGLRVRGLAQMEALEHLIGIMGEQDEEHPHPPVPAYRSTESLHHQARLRIARAAYALATNGDMVRVGAGAWIRRRHIR